MHFSLPPSLGSTAVSPRSRQSFSAADSGLLCCLRGGGMADLDESATNDAHKASVVAKKEGSKRISQVFKSLTKRSRLAVCLS